MNQLIRTNGSTDFIQIVVKKRTKVLYLHKVEVVTEH